MYELYFTPQHEWARFNGREVTVGLTGRGMTGDVVYIEMPAVGRRFERDEACASVETAKMVMEVHAPVDGRVTAVNDAVLDDPDSISRQPMETWLFRLRAGDDGREGLLTEREYNAL